MPKKIQFLAYYLPQFHPIPENDEWWGKGFTEWTNVVKAKPLFKNHRQPVLPSDLGFYDLRLPEVQEAQSKLAEEYGIDGFIYYQYWFNKDKILLEKPAEAMLKNKNIKTPFCFCWANETWKGIWHGLDNPAVLIEQEYGGAEAYEAYFNYLLPFFQDERYIIIDNMPMFHLYKIHDIPDFEIFVNTFNRLAISAGFRGIYFISAGYPNSIRVTKNEHIFGVVGTDIFNRVRYNYKPVFSSRLLQNYEIRVKKKLGFTNDVSNRKKPLAIEYKNLIAVFDQDYPHKKYIPCAIPNWDNSSRTKNKSLIFHNSKPEFWKEHLNKTVSRLLKNPENPQFVIIKSWNEWAEGNHLEPDQKFGRKWLEAIKEVRDENDC
ncbi:glycosyltransferase WbsX family protein [Halpernia sp. GG3]